ncbi:hypothetical protein [Desulforegula conservatrix]|uniref:hypothetical protein n=1 Tax=Desulforegula conservatrix TaxID=153026 RepID=UPI0004052A1C|nr:hypothetical protein [Desulforegula conservatrix]
MIETVISNIKWIFSGVGVLFLGYFINKKRKPRPNIKVSTKGKNSPGIVNGDYNVNEKKYYKR